MPSIPNTIGGAPAPTPAWPIPSGGHTPAVHQHRHHEYQQHRQAAFQALRPVTTQLLLLRDQPERLQPQLLALEQLVSELPPEGVEGCWDYVAFPLMVLLDAVMPSRQAARQPGQQSSGGGGGGGAGGGGGGAGGGGAPGGELVAAACRSDRVLEALLGALLALLERVPLPPPHDRSGSQPGGGGRVVRPGAGAGDGGGGPAATDAPATDRAVAVLQRLAPLLQLSREEASEEVHIAMQRCAAAALAPLATAAAKAVDAAAANANSRGGGGSGGGGGGAVLCSEELTPLAGYLLHCCLEVSEREVLAGHRGSKALCAAALTTLGALLAALPDPDVVAFFLPGVVSGLSKHLYAAGTAAAASGPSAPPGATATVQALSCLSTAVTTVLSDENTAAILGPDAFVGGGAAPPATSGQPLQALPPIQRAEDALSRRRAPEAPDRQQQPQQQPQPQQQQQQQRRRLRVDRTRQWLEETSGRINSLLGRVLPPLCSHHRPAVRCELAAAVSALLDGCGAALAPSQPLLLQLLFTLAQDEWRQVAAPALEWVARRAPPAEAAGGVVGVAGGGGEVGGSGKVEDGGGVGAAGSRHAAPEATAAATADLTALQDEFERFMQGLMSDSALLEPPVLELDEREMYGGSDDAAGGRDQGAPAAPQAPGGEAADAAAAPAAAAAEPPPAAAPHPPALPGLQRLIAESATSMYLLRAVRAGEAEAVVRGRCLTTALLVAGPRATAEWLLLRPAALTDLLTGLFRCFAFDRNAATLVLHLRGEAGSYAPAIVAAPAAAGAAAAPAAAVAAAAALAGGAAAAAELPRMPLGLLHLASQRSYAALAAVARSLGRLARAADVQAAAGGAAAAPQPGGGAVLRRLVDELATDLRRAVARGSAGAAAGSVGAAATGAGRRGRWAAAEASQGLDDDYDVDYEEGEEDGESRGGGSGVGGGAAMMSASGVSGGLQGEGSWQCEAAAVVAVTAEVIIGASNPWVPPLGAAPEPPPPGAPEAPPPFPAADPALESILLGLLQELMRPAIVKLPTRNDGSGGGRQAAAAAVGAAAVPLSYDRDVHSDLAAAAARPLSAQALGENVMLLRVVLEAVGAAARAVGRRFATQGRLLRAVLVPLLELLGDPSPPVAAAADTALQSICLHCGYGGSLSSLLGANADYVVDSLCGRLRDLQRHPRAPQLLAALLRRAGVAPQVLPLMAEPLQRTLQGLSPLARHWAPHYSHSYLAVLRELAAGAAAEAAAAGEDSRSAVAELNRLAAAARDREQAAADAAAAAADGGGGGDEPVSHEEIRRYFMERNDAEAEAEGQRRPVLTLTAGQLEDGELRFRRLHAAATVAGAAADAATPLLLSRDLRAAVAAAEVLRGALAALAAATPAVEAEAAVLEEYGGPEARLRPVRPETPKVLPVVAAAWTPLMAALRDDRTPVVERGLGVLAELVAAGGGTFLARRFQQEAWPVLQRLLTHGSAHTPGLLSLGTDAARTAPPPRRRLEIGGADIVVSGGEDAAAALAPAAVSRVRVAALRCLEAVCRCKDAAVAVRTLTWDIAQAALPFLGSSHPPPLLEAAHAALLAVAALDPDGVWLLLYDTSYNMPPSLAAAPAGRAHVSTADKGHPPPHSQHQKPPPPQQQQQQPFVHVPVGSEVSPGPAFPFLRSLLPPLPGTGAGRHGRPSSLSSSQPTHWPVTSAVAADCGPRAQSLLGAVAALEVPWHATQVPLLDGAATAESWA
ncbi:hypothetical protein PLESTB_001500300 [Pleodorina starrii]|uniref:Uncharacterized protein n=1 Tax=Pleodorina starrii TaxID=330485 RepID=A0A9W6BWJ0_9CHLO|nr:hypothetical protein PLESTB_001500300 [Pleodorina starrii]